MRMRGSLLCLLALTGCTSTEFYVMVPRESPDPGTELRRLSEHEQVSTVEEVVWSWRKKRTNYELTYAIADRPLLPNVRITAVHETNGASLSFDPLCTSAWISCANLASSEMQCSSMKGEPEIGGRICFLVDFPGALTPANEVFEFDVRRVGGMTSFDGP